MYFVRTSGLKLKNEVYYKEVKKHISFAYRMSVSTSSSTSSFRFVHLGVLAMVAVIVVVGFFSASAVSGSPVLSVAGTVAGYGTTLQVEGLSQFEQVMLSITSPKDNSFQLAAKADSKGKISYTVDDIYTRVAGKYLVSVISKNNSETIATGSFNVNADTSSPDHSGVVASKDVVHLGAYDFSVINVKLTDLMGNPVQDHFITVISSRISDAIKPLKAGVTRTDKNGMVSFAVTSTLSGQSDYTVYDLNTQKAVGDPVHILYIGADAPVSPAAVAPLASTTPVQSSYLSASVLGAVGGNYVAANTLEAGPAESFKFEDMPTSIKTNQPFDFTVTAYDANQKLAVGYLGTVHFQATGSNNVFASLPKDYTFTADDLGKHIFPLAMQFQQEGTYEIDVTDTVKKTATGHISLIVKGGSAAVAADTKVTITTPSPGSYSTNTQNVTGTAPAGKDVKLFDGQDEIGTAVTNVQGAYSFTTQPLVDGEHNFSVSVLDQAGTVLGTSDKVKILIDTQPPKVDSVVLTPGFDVTPGLTVQVELKSEEKLKKALLDINGTVTELSEDLEKAGTYHGTFAAPDKDGSYDVKFTLSDDLNNESVITYATKLQVTTAGTIKPVRQLKAVPGAFKISLSWTAPEGNAPIDHYRIFYGTDPQNLTGKVDTVGNVLSWYIPNLTNNTPYYFGVVGMDKSGYVGEAGTLAVATPLEDGAVGTLPVADSYISTLGMRGKTGPEVLWLVPLSIVAGRFLKRKRRK